MNRKPSLLVIFLSVFIDLIGFGIVLPLLPTYADDNFTSTFAAKGLVIGAIGASFSAMQFLFAPAWGRLSDRIGRRPVMLISNLGAAGSYALFAVASGMNGTTGLIWILVSRIFAGICGANLSVASAYIADISPPEKRTARMGLIGMAFGLGFIFGPALGSFILGESRKPSSESAAARPKVNQWAHTLAQPKLGLLIGVFFFATFCFTCFEFTFPLFLRYGFGFAKNDYRVGYLFTYAGLIAAILQGGIVGRLVKKFGEPKLIFSSMIIFAIGMTALPFQTHMAGLFIVLALLAIGSGLNRPPVFGMISLNSSADEQGANFGVAQSFGSLARILGPMFANIFFFVDIKLPYLICGGLALLTALFAWKSLCGENSGITAVPKK